MARLFRTRTSRFKEPVREEPSAGVCNPAYWAGTAQGLSPETQLYDQKQPAEPQQ